MSYELLKSFHLIFIITWFAGLFYLGRIFVYIAESYKKPTLEADILLPQLHLMAKRLWMGITVPSSIFTLIFGVSLLVKTGLYTETWMHAKILLLILLFSYHLSLGVIRKKLLKNTITSPLVFRYVNEVPVFFLVGIIFLVVYKELFDFLQVFATFIGLVLFIAITIQYFAKKRNK